MGFISRALGGNQQVVTLAAGGSTRAIPMSINHGAKDNAKFDRSILEEDYRYDPLTFNIINKNVQIMMHAGFGITTKTARWQKFYDIFFEGIGDVGEETTKEELVEYILQDILMYGNSFVELIYKDGNIEDKVLDLRVIPEKFMDFAKNGSGEIALDRSGRPMGYIMKLPYGQSSRGRGDELTPEETKRVSVGDNEIFFRPERIAHFKLYTYGDRFYGMGLIEASHSSTFRKLKIEDARTNEIYTRGSNTIIATVGDNEHEPSPQDLKQTLENISKFRHDRYFSFPKWVKVETLPVEENAATDKTLDYLRENQSASAGMPMAIITGQGETANKQTLETQQFVLELSLENIIKKFSSSFKKYILKPIAISNNIPEIADIVFGDIVAEDKTSKNDRLTSAVRNGIIAPEEARPYVLKAEGLEENAKAYKDFRKTEKAKPKKLPSAPFPDSQEEAPAEMMQLSDKSAVELGGFYMPDIRKHINIEELNPVQTLERHQTLHVLWGKLEGGFRIGWTFEELYLEHKKAVERLTELNLAHLAPINDLDQVSN